MSNITIKIDESVAEKIVAEAAAIKVLFGHLDGTIIPEGEFDVLEDVCNQIKAQLNERKSTLEQLGINKQDFKKIVLQYLCDYAEACPEDANEVSENQHPNWGELDSYMEKYPELMTTLMNGGDEEFEDLVTSVITMWKA